uniref:Cystatin domain-containing protein n=1 Tax=Arcella intermedia TaxID=1963864 RepID=A0A6B2LVB1_9EUKA
MAGRVGGIGQEKDVDDTVRQLVSTVKGLVEAKTAVTYETFTPVKYASQVVAGTNFFVKIDVGGSYIHARIFRPLGNAAPSVHSVQTGKTLEEPINYF